MADQSNNAWVVWDTRPGPVVEQGLQEAYIQQDDRVLPKLTPGWETRARDRTTLPYASYMYGGEVRLQPFTPVTYDQLEWFSEPAKCHADVRQLDFASIRQSQFQTEDGLPIGGNDLERLKQAGIADLRSKQISDLRSGVKRASDQRAQDEEYDPDTGMKKARAEGPEPPGLFDMLLNRLRGYDSARQNNAGASAGPPSSGGPSTSTGGGGGSGGPPTPPPPPPPPSGGAAPAAPSTSGSGGFAAPTGKRSRFFADDVDFKNRFDASDSRAFMRDIAARFDSLSEAEQKGGAAFLDLFSVLSESFIGDFSELKEEVDANVGGVSPMFDMSAIGIDENMLQNIGVAILRNEGALRPGKSISENEERIQIMGKAMALAQLGSRDWNYSADALGDASFVNAIKRLAVGGKITLENLSQALDIIVDASNLKLGDFKKGHVFGDPTTTLPNMFQGGGSDYSLNNGVVRSYEQVYDEAMSKGIIGASPSVGFISQVNVPRLSALFQGAGDRSRAMAKAHAPPMGIFSALTAVPSIPIPPTAPPAPSSTASRPTVVSASIASTITPVAAGPMGVAAPVAPVMSAQTVADARANLKKVGFPAPKKPGKTSFEKNIGKVLDADETMREAMMRRRAKSNVDNDWK